MGRDHLDALLRELCVERVGVVGGVTDEPSRPSSNERRSKSGLYKGDFMRRSTGNAGRVRFLTPKGLALGTGEEVYVGDDSRICRPAHPRAETGARLAAHPPSRVASRDGVFASRWAE
jgi:hypothetical protein